MEITTQEILLSTQGQLVQERATHFHQVVIDGREATPGSLFIAIQGMNQDGHQFIAQASEKGATAALIAKERGKNLAAQFPHLTLIEVPDTTLALGQIAKFYRQKSEFAQNVTVIAITGSYGKTTTKELLSSILQTYAPSQVLSTEGNLNNHFGVPLMLLRLEKQHRFAVLELGMSALGEIAYLTSLCKPHLGIITGVGPAHLEQLGSLENIAQAKLELFQGLPKGSIAIYPEADLLLSSFLSKAEISKNQLQFWPISEKNTQIQAPVQIKNSQVTVSGLSATVVCTQTQQLPTETFEVHTPLLGFYERNLGLAIAAARALGIPTPMIQKGISQVKPSKHRSMLVQKANRTFIDDCYNANPESTKAAIQLLSSLRKEHQKIWMVFGDMLELGKEEIQFHQQIGEAVAAQRMDGLLTLGERAKEAASIAAKQGIFTKSFPSSSVEELKHTLFQISQPGDFILLKGSRGMQLERILEEPS